jgi:N-acetyl-anhydromuramyl-L-alanine amidase AmpD
LTGGRKPPIVSREEWRAKEPDPNSEEGFFSPENPNGYAKYSDLGYKSLKDVLNTVVIHHSGNYPSYDVREVQKQHTDEGMADIGYHYIVAPDGTIYEGRDIGARGFHVENANTGKIGILLMGDFQPGDEIRKSWIIINLGPELDDYGPPTDKQATSVTNLVRYLDVKYGIESVVGHRDVPGNQTVCPGDLCMPLVKALNDVVKEQ